MAGGAEHYDGAPWRPLVPGWLREAARREAEARAAARVLRLIAEALDADPRAAGALGWLREQVEAA